MICIFTYIQITYIYNYIYDMYVICIYMYIIFELGLFFRFFQKQIVKNIVPVSPGLT